MNALEARHKKSVANIIRPLVNDAATQNIFLMWPNLVGITERFCNFVSPLMPSSSGEPLVSNAIQAAILAYRNEKDDNLKGRAYVIGLLRESADALSSLTVHGVRDDLNITWEPFIEPMLSWMVRNRIATIRTSKNSRKLNPETAKTALLAHILSAQDIESMKLAAGVI